MCQALLYAGTRNIAVDKNDKNLSLTETYIPVGNTFNKQDKQNQ